MKDSKKVIATKRFLEQQGENSEEIEAILNITRANEENEKKNSLRAWIAVVISGIALVVSVLVAIYK
jgi:hypothetical protein